ncbi:outer membrane protein [Tropicimonas sp. IMCC34011]|uniref:outer membrane protein n=1 Tax=Tropicimonas sp. IMCC34011 TaxID=2248759 RepID=UPI000E267D14|nr:outer membrane beta-barrel protein [Tropicimonas sp. IMCC34011]
MTGIFSARAIRATVLLCAILSGAGAAEAQDQTWAGPYLGVQAGGAEAGGLEFDGIVEPVMESMLRRRTGPGALQFPALLAGAEMSGPEIENRSPIYGIHAGWDWQAGAVVWGVELAVTRTETRISIGEDGLELDYAARLMGRLGYDAGDALVYVAAGPARAKFSAYGDMMDAAFTDDSFTATGLALAAGTEVRLRRGWTLGGEVVRHSYDDWDMADVSAELTTFSLKLTHRF